MRPLALAALLLVLLAGCAPTRAMPGEPTGDELDALIAIELDYQWQYVGLTPDSPRPAVEQIRMVSMDEAEAVHKKCMVDAGYGSYSQGTAAVFGSSNYERLALYICSAQYPVPPSNLNLFSKAQLRYLYDYYETSVIPCLRAAGVPVTDVPSEGDFLTDGNGQLFYSAWTPYGGLQGSVVDEYIYYERCPNYPDGFLGR
jgi:hypothetical protein